jgi:hypothetical protein
LWLHQANPPQPGSAGLFYGDLEGRKTRVPWADRSGAIDVLPAAVRGHRQGEILGQLGEVVIPGQLPQCFSGLLHCLPPAQGPAGSHVVQKVRVLDQQSSLFNRKLADFLNVFRQRRIVDAGSH